jgi:beta-phosphoglucomutase-like phosphatase (HAD superfamily)
MFKNVLFDMGGTLEDIWYNDETEQAATQKLIAILRRSGLEPGCEGKQFFQTLFARYDAYKKWSERTVREKKPDEIWPDALQDFGFPAEKVMEIAEELADTWECTYFHRELRPGVRDVLEGLRQRGFRMGVVSNTSSLYAPLPRAPALRRAGVFRQRDPLQHHQLPQARQGAVHHLHVPDALQPRGVRLCGRHRLPGHHRRQAGGLRPGRADPLLPHRPEGTWGWRIARSGRTSSSSPSRSCWSTWTATPASDVPPPFEGGRRACAPSGRTERKKFSRRQSPLPPRCLIRRPPGAVF